MNSETAVKSRGFRHFGIFNGKLPQIFYLKVISRHCEIWVVLILS
jgi:hypothetical protein